MPSAQIAVIGAGMTGITAARQLVSAGQNVKIFEKSRGSGGRLASKRSTIGRINLGAQHFKAAENQFIADLHSWQQAGWVEHSTETNCWAGIPYMSALTRNLLAAIPTQFSCEIASLNQTCAGWQLYDQHGQSHGPFQQVLIAVPAPQAQMLLSTCAPQLAKQAAAVTMQPAWIVALGLEAPITAPNNLRQLHNSSIAELIYLPQSTEQPMPAVIIQASPEWSWQYLEEQPAQVITALSKACETLLKCPLPATTHAFAHRWRYAQGALKQTTAFFAEPQRGLYLAGDWCGAGDVQSAWRSGKQAAQHLLNSL